MLKKKRVDSVDAVSDTMSKTGIGDQVLVSRVSDEPEILIYYDRDGKVALRNEILAQYEKRVPYSGRAKTEADEQYRVKQNQVMLDEERYSRQLSTINLALDQDQYLRLQDPYELPSGSYICEDGTYKQGAIRSFARFLKRLFTNVAGGKYKTMLTDVPDNVDRVDWRVYRLIQGQHFNMKRGYISGDTFPMKGDLLTLHDRISSEIYVSETYVNSSTIFLLYLKFFNLYTLNCTVVPSGVIEPSYFKGFNYRLLHQILFGLPAESPALSLI